MKYRTLGRTGLRVSEIGLGGYMFAPIYPDHATDTLDYLSPKVVDDIFDASLRLGVNFVDTASKYGYGESERMIGASLAKRRESHCAVATKIGGLPKDVSHYRDADYLLVVIDEARQRLQVDTVEVMQIHEADLYDWWWDEPETGSGPVTDALVEARARGWVRYIGVTGTSAAPLVPLVESGVFDVVLTSIRYDLLWREAARELLPACARRNIGVICGTPFHQGVLSKRRDDWFSNPPPDLKPAFRRKQLRALYDLLDNTGIPLPELGLRWLLSDERVSCVVAGPRNAREAELNARVSEADPLPDEVVAQLDEIGAMEDASESGDL